MIRSSLVAATLALSAGCGSAAEPSEPESVSVVSRSGTLQLTNRSARSVYFFIYERQAAAAINWAQSVAGPGIPPGRRATVRYTDIGGYAPNTAQAILWWWEAVAGPGGRLEPGEIHALIVSF